jgi:hypothetical protein
MSEQVYEYTIHLRENNGWFTVVKRHIWAHNCKAAADAYAEIRSQEGLRGPVTFAVQSNVYRVFKVYQVTPIAPCYEVSLV